MEQQLLEASVVKPAFGKGLLSKMVASRALGSGWPRRPETCLRLQRATLAAEMPLASSLMTD